MIISDMYYAIKHTVSKNKGICPKCGFTAFEHGYFPHEEFYCTKCHLWEPNWEERNQWIEQLKREGKI